MIRLNIRKAVTLISVQAPTVGPIWKSRTCGALEGVCRLEVLPPDAAAFIRQSKSLPHQGYQAPY